MITTTTDKNINLTQLDKELGGFGLCMNEEDPSKKIIGIANDSSVTLNELEEAIRNHIAQDYEQEKIEARAALLAKLGITEDEAKLLLG